jgi:DNA-binding winged helix-turn-helix (wHTH) protein/Tfp pilus assembly protein PilF
VNQQTAQTPVIRFGVFEADMRSGELRNNGVRVKLQDLPFRVLQLFLSRPNEVISREEFRQALWPGGIFVDFDHGISSAINRLRIALRDSADNPRFIETMDRRGYRWIAPTHALRPIAEQAGALRLVPDNGLSGSHREPVGPAPSKQVGRWRARLPLFKTKAALILGTGAVALLFSAWVYEHRYRAVAPPSLNTGSGLHAANSAAVELYLKGRYYWNKRTPDDLNKAIDYFTQAIVRDPGYAKAYAGLADCYNLLPEFGAMPANEAYPRALAAARKAVELDNTSADAHTTLAFAMLYWKWDEPGAEREFLRAIALDPSYAPAHHWYATSLLLFGRFSEALAQIDLAQKLDPSSASILADKGMILYYSGQPDASIVLLKQIEFSEPDFASSHRYLTKIYYNMGDYAHYLQERRALAVSRHDEQGVAITDAAEKGLGVCPRNSI